jgi:hypothetical protein
MSERGDNSVLTGVLVLAGIAAAGFTMVAVRVGEAFAIPVGIVAFIAAAVVLRGPLGTALARRLEGGRNVPEHDVQALVEQLDTVRDRLAELEERVDFTERVLSRQREPGRLER